MDENIKPKKIHRIFPFVLVSQDFALGFVSILARLSLLIFAVKVPKSIPFLYQVNVANTVSTAKLLLLIFEGCHYNTGNLIL